MILVDANILVYAHVQHSSQHERARLWLDERLNGFEAVGLPWGSLLAFLRVVTNRRIFSPPVTMATALNQLASWLDAQSVWVPAPTDRHAEVLANLLARPGVSADLVPDAHLAALAIEHGLTLCSSDRDFARFPGLRWVNPLAG